MWGSKKHKKNILKRLYRAPQAPHPLPEKGALPPSATIFNQTESYLPLYFSQSFTKIGGQLIHCSNPLEAYQKLLALTQLKKWSAISYAEPEIADFLKRYEADFSYFTPNIEAPASLTRVRHLIARTGSICIDSSRQGRRASIYPSAHICIAYAEEIVFDIADALSALPAPLPSLLCLISGVSRTADIEKTLVTGVHGPKELYLFLIDPL